MKKKTISKSKGKKSEPLGLLWIVDGFVGVLALVIYNFCLYLLGALNAGGLFSDLENTMGYFGINSFIDFGFTKTQMTVGLLLVFAFSFFLGMIIGNMVRKSKGKII